MSRRALRLGLVLALAAGPAASEPPNVLLLLAEDLSPRIGAFGDPVAVTPNLDALAAQGVRYPNTFTAAGVCAPSRAALMAGMAAISVGAMHMRSFDRGYFAQPPAEMKAFPELLRRAGIYTYTDSKLDYQWAPTLAAIGEGPFGIWDETGARAHWRNRADGQPFFGLVNFGVTHESGVFRRSGVPHSPMHLLFQLSFRWQLRGHDDVVGPEDVVMPPYYADTPTMRRDIAQHYNNIHAMDAQVGKLLAELEADGLAGNTIVIWSTDHGDGLPRAKREVYDSGIRVPMIVRWPEALRPGDQRPGDVEEQLVSFVDLAPTILETMGVERPAHLQGRVFTGRTETPARRYVFAAADRVDEVPDRKRAVRDARWKYIRNYHPQSPTARPLSFRDNQEGMRELWALRAEGTLPPDVERWFLPRPLEELYDTRADPHEIRNLAYAPAHADTLRRLRGALDGWLDAVGDQGAEPEETMIARLLPDGRIPTTRPPTISFTTHEGRPRLELSSETEGASLGYRLGDDRLRLYTGPVEVEAGQSVEACAVRYGFEESETASARAPR